MHDSSLTGPRLIWVFLLGVVLLNNPVLSLFDRGVLLGGFPLIYLYLLAVWAGLIGLLAWTLAPWRRRTDDADRAADEDGPA